MAAGATDGVVAQTNGRKKPEVNPPVDVAIALQANEPEAVPEILKGISSFGATPSIDDATTRLSLLAKARELVHALETPRETMIKHCWAQVRLRFIQHEMGS
jgi:hypothetical protein